MSRRSRDGLLVAGLLGLIGSIGAVLAQDSADTRSDDRDKAVMTRFLTVVEKAPRRGTALDRVYGYHVERGTLDSFLKTYQDRTTTDPKDGVAWMILGLVESQRGRDAAAVAALRKAEAARPDDAMPCYYLGQSLVLVGQPDDAAQAFERAINRKPSRADVLEIFQALGRVYQRAHRNEQALAVWSRLEKLFPDDPRVQEQIAASLAEEAQPDQALPRYEALAKSTKDRFRQVQFLIDVAELKVRLNRSNEALNDFEALLGKLDPDSWLYREVRRKIEEIFTRGDDQAGLSTYYEKWIKKTPDDVEAMARLGKALAAQGRLSDARGWYEKAVGLAPSRRDVRAALIEQLLIEKKYPEAAAQYEAIAKADPSNPDAIREWGRVLLRDTSRPEADRKKAAAAIWRRLIEARPDDPSTLVAVADLYRTAELNDEAIGLYKTAVARSPNAPQYAEYLGEFYHRLKRPQEAIATWSKMAEGANRNAKTLGRLAEVYSGFGYKAEALGASTEAARLDRDDFDLQLRLADLLHAAEKLDDERIQLEFAAKAASSEEQTEGVLDREIKNYQASGTLSSRSESLRKDLEAGKIVTAERWRRLARYLETDQKPSEALAAAHQALTIDGKSVPTLAMVARLNEVTGNLSGAADVLRRLAEVDRRGRTEYLTGVARLEARLGRKDAALKAGRDLLAAAPGQLDNHQFFADLCFQLGQIDEGLDALRRAVRLNEADPKAILGLAETLSTQFRTEEAIEMFWRAFEKSPDLEAKLAVVTRLTALYLQRNQFDRLIARLERQGREVDRQREMTICLAQAYSSSGDFGTARSELERLLSTNPRDTKLLYQLSVLSESEGDSATAAKFQKQMIELAPSDESIARLAQLYIQAGDINEAEALWAKLAAGGEPESHRVLMAIDSLLGHGKKDAVLGIVENLLRKRPDNWEALYRQAQTYALLDKPVEAARQFRALLDLKGNDDDLGAVARAKKKGMGGPTDPNGANAANSYAPSKTFPLQDRITKLYNIRGACQIDSRFVSGSVWSPDDLGQARMASVGWLFTLATKAGTQDALLIELHQAADKAKTDPRAHWNLYYLQLLRVEYAEIFEAARGLVKVASTDPVAQFAFLNAVPIHNHTAQTPIINSSTTTNDPTPPLPDDELDQVMLSYRTLKTQKPDWIHSAILTAVAEELKRAKRTDALDQFYRAALESITDPDSAVSVLRLAAERGNTENVIKLYDRYERLAGNKQNAIPNLYVYYGGYYTLSSTPADSFCRAMLARADAKAPGDVARLLDHYLAASRRPDRIARRTRSIASVAAVGRRNQFQVWTGKTARFTMVSFPNPNPYYDIASIQVLRNAYELYKRDDLLSDLRGHLQESLKVGTDTDQAYTHLALCYLYWWEEDKDEALRELTEAAKASKADPELLLSLAELRAQRNEPEEALRVADSFEPLDQKAMQRREILAIRLAVVTGDVGRARKAAERLFGLRLDADTQIQLASQMNQLGMHELAEAVLGRARRRAGGNLTALVSLMLQYQRQGKPDVAVQVAHQVLRRSTAKANPGYYDEGDEARSEAVQVLARSGKIKEMIERLELQVQRTPGSFQLHQRLADYYKASGDKVKAKLEYDAMTRLRPDDAKLRFQVASDLMQAENYDGAVEQYKAALKKDPSLLGSSFYEIQRAFQQAGKFDDLITLIEEADIRLIGQVYYVARMIQTILQDNTKRDRGMALFAKVWKAYPGQRDTLFSYINTDEIWLYPEMYDYLREATLPAPGRKTVPTWLGLEESIRSGNNGKTNTLGGRLIEIAERRGKLESLNEEIERAERRLPGWRSGSVLRAMILARQSRFNEARTLVAPLADPKQADASPALVRQVLGQEWEEIPALRPMAVTLFESSMKEVLSDGLIYSYNPAQRLIEMYRRSGQPEVARRELLGYLRKVGLYSQDAGVAAYYKILDRTEIAAKLLELGFPCDSARIYDETLADNEAFDLAKDYVGNSNSQKEMLRKGLQASLQALDVDALDASLQVQLANPGSLDLQLMIQPRELEQATVASMVGAAIQSAAGQPGRLEGLRGKLEKYAEAQPRDMASRVALTLASLAGGPPEVATRMVASLRKLVEESPLEPIKPGERANSRQRLEATGQLGLWLVARDCSSRPEFQASAQVFADRAIEAARRQIDPIWPIAMLREAGQVALDRGDKASAEIHWSRMLGLILGTSSPSSATTMTPDGDTTPKKSGVPVATLERFEQTMKLAKLASVRGLMAFSLRAAREPLRGGPPVIPLTIRASGSGSGSSNPQDRVSEQAIDQVVERQFAELVTAWTDHRAPVAEVYEILRDAVLPEGRPSEAFVYARPFEQSGQDRPRSVADLLVRWAIRADRVPDLRQRLEARRKVATAEAASLTILVELDLALGDYPAANRGLTALGARLAQDKLQSTADLACQAALSAFSIAETEQAAILVLDAAMATFVTGGSESAAIKLQTTQAHRYFATGRVEVGRQRVSALLESLDRATSAGLTTYRSFSASFQSRRENLQTVAAEYARAGQWDQAIETLGQVADAPISANRRIIPPPPVAFAMVARHLATLPPLERYEKLRAWTMPNNENRSIVRSLAAFGSAISPPESFGRSSTIGDGSGLLASLEMLVAAARDAGKLDELADQARLAFDSKRENAEALWTLVQIARGRSTEVEPSLRSLLADWSKKVDEVYGPTTGSLPPSKPIPWGNYLRVRAALGDPKLAGLARQLAAKFPSKDIDLNLLSHLRFVVAASLVGREPGQPLGLVLDPELSFWAPMGAETASSSRLGAPTAIWAAGSGHIHRRVGSFVARSPYDYSPPSLYATRPDTLVFQVPLTGRFEVSMDATGTGAEVGYGGLMLALTNPVVVTRLNVNQMQPRPGPNGKIQPIGAVDSIPRTILLAPNPGTNHLTIQVAPGSVRYLVNGHLVFEDHEPNPSNPWLVLGGSGDAEVDFRNLVIQGEPVIPREVKLTQAGRLEGWLSDFYEETRSSRKIGPDGRYRTSPLGPVTESVERKDWSIVDGMILGRRDPAPSAEERSQSRLSYHRPLRPGESVTYEFFHETDALTAQPALGRLAFLLEPAGVRLHWLTNGPEVDLTGLAPGNVVDEPSARRGPTPLPLKASDWNLIKLTMLGRAVEIELNGIKVFERDLEPTNDRVFSITHDKDRTALQVREIILKGDWPLAFTADALTLKRTEPTLARRKGQSALIGEAAFATDAGAVLRSTATLGPDPRYQALLDWVVPSPEHTSFRLAGEFAPTDSAILPPSAPSPAIPNGLTRVHVGGGFDAPALALIAAARAANKLDDLADRVEKAAPATDLDRRGRLALLALVKAEEGSTAPAIAALEALKPLLESVAIEAPEAERWPELVAIAGARGRPELLPAARSLGDVLNVAPTQKDQNPTSETWKLHAAQLAALLTRPELASPGFAPDLGLGQWSRVTQTRSRSRGTGAPLPVWLVSGEVLTHLPGLDRDFVYFRTPLRGDFEVSGEVFGGRAIHLAYGGVTVGLAIDGKEVVVTPLGGLARRTTLEPSMTLGDGSHRIKLAVKASTLRVWLDDRKLHEQGLPDHPDPWFAISQPSGEVGQVRKLKIEGNPTVPDTLELSDQPDLIGWLIDDGKEPLPNVDPAWEKRGDEIQGRHLKGAVGSKQESTLRYHRPLLEDGEVAYEFFQAPGQSIVHPVLDRLAFLIEPGGVKLHRLTDGAYERTGLSPDNATVEADCRRGPAASSIKVGEWNRMVLALAGDRVTLQLNDELIYDRAIEPTNQRTFGLFHYADEAQARLRQVRYRGAWARQKPTDLDFR